MASRASLFIAPQLAILGVCLFSIIGLNWLLSMPIFAEIEET